MDVQTAFAQDNEHPCSRSTQVMPFTAAKMSRYACTTVCLLTCSSVETMMHRRSSTLRGHLSSLQTVFACSFQCTAFSAAPTTNIASAPLPLLLLQLIQPVPKVCMYLSNTRTAASSIYMQQRRQAHSYRPSICAPESHALLGVRLHSA